MTVSPTARRYRPPAVGRAEGRGADGPGRTWPRRTDRDPRWRAAAAAGSGVRRACAGGGGRRRRELPPRPAALRGRAGPGVQPGGGRGCGERPGVRAGPTSPGGGRGATGDSCSDWPRAPSAAASVPCSGAPLPRPAQRGVTLPAIQRCCSKPPLDDLGLTVFAPRANSCRPGRTPFSSPAGRGSTAGSTSPGMTLAR